MGTSPPHPPACRVCRPRPSAPDRPRDAALLERTVFEVKRIIVGQDRLVERMLVGLLAKGHLLIEGVPGVAKTLAVETFAKVVGGTFNRIQFTPDLVPADLLGTRIYRAGREEFDTELGPVMANFVLTDEINRAPAKVQSALLEVMAERHVSIGGVTYPMPRPVPGDGHPEPDRERRRVYPLPEAQRDRFLFKLMVGYPEPDEEREIVYRMGVVPPVAQPGAADHGAGAAAAWWPPTSSCITRWSTTWCGWSTRPGRRPSTGLTEVAGWLSYGASPRASLGIIAAARALALVRGRDFVVPQDVVDVAPDVLRHRLVLSYDALADGIPDRHHPDQAAAGDPAAAGDAPFTQTARRLMRLRARTRSDRTPRAWSPVPTGSVVSRRRPPIRLGWTRLWPPWS